MKMSQQFLLVWWKEKVCKIENFELELEYGPNQSYLFLNDISLKYLVKFEMAIVW